MKRPALCGPLETFDKLSTGGRELCWLLFIQLFERIDRTVKEAISVTRNMLRGKLHFANYNVATSNGWLGSRALGDPLDDIFQICPCRLGRRRLGCLSGGQCGNSFSCEPLHFVTQCVGCAMRIDSLLVSPKMKHFFGGV